MMKEHKDQEPIPQSVPDVSTPIRPAPLNVQSQLLDSVRETVVATDLNSRIFYWGPGAEKLYGYTAQEVLNKPYRNFAGSIEPMDAAQEEAFRQEIIRKGSWKGEHVQRKRDGTTFWTSTLISLIVDEKGRPIGFIGIDQDISDRKRTEEERARLQEQLAQAQKMESVGRLAGGVAHDFNNMLGVIIGHAEMALMQTAPENPIRDDLDEIMKAAERSANLTRQLLAFARKQTIAPKALNLNETVEGMLTMLRRLIGENIDLQWNPADHLWPVRMDPVQIDQILANLLVNARDAISGVGRVVIETQNVTVDESVCSQHEGAEAGDHVVLRVHDTGCGINPATQKMLFEPFFTTKEPGKGTGLGLATVYGIVRQNRGFITINSMPGAGATFSIYLPRQHGTPVQASAPVPDAPIPGAWKTILLVEDEPILLQLVRTFLENLNYTVLAANTPGEAIRFVEDHTGDIHLIITDVVMPEMNGRDLAEQVLIRQPGIRCLFMSGHTAEIIARHGILEENVHFLQKPFSMQEFAAKVQSVLA